MRIMSFSQKWDKLQNPVFTTFRYPRVDTDWREGELVQVFYKNRSPQRENLGIAEIINKERRNLDLFFTTEDGTPLATDEEAVADGFVSRKDMANYMIEQYGLDYVSLFNKLTLKWITRSEPAETKRVEK